MESGPTWKGRVWNAAWTGRADKWLTEVPARDRVIWTRIGAY